MKHQYVCIVRQWNCLPQCSGHVIRCIRSSGIRCLVCDSASAAEARSRASHCVEFFRPSLLFSSPLSPFPSLFMSSLLSSRRVSTVFVTSFNLNWRHQIHQKKEEKVEGEVSTNTNRTTLFRSDTPPPPLHSIGKIMETFDHESK